MTLAFAIRALRGHLVLVLITFVVVTGVGMALGSYLPKSYSSNAQILLGVDPKRATIDEEAANLYLKERAMTYAQMVTSDEVIMPVATAAAIDPGVLRGRVAAAVVPETVVLDLQVTGSSPEEAVALTQALSDRFLVQVSNLNVQTGGPRMLPAQLSAPQPAGAPDQLQGKTLAAVSALAGLIVAVLLALLVAVIKRNRAASRPQPLRPEEADTAAPVGEHADAAAAVGVSTITDVTTLTTPLPPGTNRSPVNRTHRRVRAPFQTIGSRQRRLRATSRTKGSSK
jgi:capsular polysaccharide biosynthesis protein